MVRPLALERECFGAVHPVLMMWRGGGLWTGPLKYEKIRAFLEPFAVAPSRSGGKVVHEEL